MRARRGSSCLWRCPSLSGVVSPAPPATGPPEELLFRAVVRTLARMALDIASLASAPAGPRREQLLLLFAVLTGQLDEAQAIEEKVREGHEAPRRLWSRVEDALERRSMSLSG